MIKPCRKCRERRFILAPMPTRTKAFADRYYYLWRGRCARCATYMSVATPDARRESLLEGLPPGTEIEFEGDTKG